MQQQLLQHELHVRRRLLVLLPQLWLVQQQQQQPLAIAHTARTATAVGVRELADNILLLLLVVHQVLLLLLLLEVLLLLLRVLQQLLAAVADWTNMTQAAAAVCRVAASISCSRGLPNVKHKISSSW